MMQIEVGGEIDLGDGRRVKLMPMSDARPPNNLECVDAEDRRLWAATGEFSAAWWDGRDLTAYDTFGFNKTIDLRTGEVVKSVFVK